MKNSKPLSVEIPNPCGENRETMDKTQNGWFCGVCAKEVLDFTQSSDAEIHQAFKDPEHQPCGVFQPEQLSRPLSGQGRCRSYANTLKAISLVLASTLAAESCIMGVPQRPKKNHEQPPVEIHELRPDMEQSQIEIQQPNMDTTIQAPVKTGSAIMGKRVSVHSRHPKK